MTTETFAFSILAAVLGMAVVFLFLGILSFLMYAIKEFFGEGEKASATEARDGRPAAGNKTGAAGSGADGAARTGEANGGGSSNDWLIAAAVAFLLEEELDSQRSAAAWVPRTTGAGDIWHNLPRV